MSEQTDSEAEKLKVLDPTGKFKQIWGRDIISSRFNRKIEYISGNPTTIWIHDYDSKQTKKITISWDENGNPTEIKDEFIKISDWISKWGSPP